MKQIRFSLDFISPYAYLAFEQLPQALQGISHSVVYEPVLFAGLLAQHGQLGPAEIAPKRIWTYRQVLWLAQQQGIDMQMPLAHPFNPLPLLRLALACGSGAAAQPLPSRYVCEQIFRHVWRGGADAASSTRLAALTAQLSAHGLAQRDPAGSAVKTQLKNLSDTAAARGLFGVPSFEVDGQLFWGLDALPMLRAYCLGDAWFTEHSPWHQAANTAIGTQRKT